MANGVSNLTGQFDKKEFLEDCKKQIAEAQKRISMGSYDHPDLPCLVYHMGAGETDKSILDIVRKKVLVFEDVIDRVNSSSKRKTGEFLFDFHDVARMCKENFFKDSSFQTEVLRYLKKWDDCVDKLNSNRPAPFGPRKIPGLEFGSKANEAILKGQFDKKEFLEDCKKQIAEAQKRISMGSYDHPDLPCLVYHMGAGETDKSILDIVRKKVLVFEDVIDRVNSSSKRKTGEFLFDFHDVARMCKENFFKDSSFQTEVLRYLKKWDDCVDKLNSNHPSPYRPRKIPGLEFGSIANEAILKGQFDKAEILTGQFDKKEFLRDCKKQIAEAQKRILKGSYDHPDVACLVYHMGAGETVESILKTVCKEVWGVYEDGIVRVNRSAKRKTGEFLFDFHNVARMCEAKFFKDPRFQTEVLKYLKEWEDCVDKLNRNKSL